MKWQLKKRMSLEQSAIPNPVRNQDGSIIVIALMVLVVMTVVGLMSSNTVVTENFIIRNEVFYKQNINMTEAATMEILQLFMQRPPDDPNIVNVSTSPLAWINDIHDPSDTRTSVAWYAVNSTQRILDDANSMAVDTAKNLTERGEKNAGNLRCAFVGWDIVPLPGGGSESLGIGSNKAVWREGRLLSEYVSQGGGSADHGYGMVRMEIGVKRRIVIN